MSAIRIIAGKELLLLRRDVHGLLLLFAMPCLFVLIMSFALQNQYSGGQAVIEFYVLDLDQSDASAELIEQLDKEPAFALLDADSEDRSTVIQHTRAGKAQFLVTVHDNFLDKTLEQSAGVGLQIAPSTDKATALLFSAFLREKLARMLINIALANIEQDEVSGLLSGSFEYALESESLYGHDGKPPSSVQQNVPAWLLFAMFFITIPLSTTFIQERTQGTLKRLQGMGLGKLELTLGKLLPYLAINLLQVIAMLAIGVWLIPALGGDALEIGGSMAGLISISLAASLAAVSLALLVAELSQTTEQATVAAGILNIVMAAIGGIMVPRFVMPPLMQDISQWSPMAWGLDGFLDILLRNGSLYDVAPEAGKLLLMAIGCLTVLMLLEKSPKRR